MNLICEDFPKFVFHFLKTHLLRLRPVHFHPWEMSKYLHNQSRLSSVRFEWKLFCQIDRGLNQRPSISHQRLTSRPQQGGCIKSFTCLIRRWAGESDETIEYIVYMYRFCSFFSVQMTKKCCSRSFVFKNKLKIKVRRTSFYKASSFKNWRLKFRDTQFCLLFCEAKKLGLTLRHEQILTARNLPVRQKNWENYIKKSFVIYTLHLLPLVKHWDGMVRRRGGGDEKQRQDQHFLLENLWKETKWEN
jgi:hypothetical protein